jgi:Anti-sigma-K factor rskA/Putative zinc-finger
MSEVSMPPDASNPELAHADVAGWALGALEPADAEAFELHLAQCAECQADVAGFDALTRALNSPAPAVEPSADLEARTLASVQHAIMTSGQRDQAKTVQPAVMTATAAREAPRVASVQNAVHEAKWADSLPHPAPARMSRWWHWHWNFPVLLAAACGAAAAVIAMVVVQQAGQIGSAAALAKFPLRAQGNPATGTVLVYRGPNGFRLDAMFSHLPRLKGGEYYECWYLKSASDPGSEAITAGSFKSGHDGSGTFPMTSAANPRAYKVMEIAIQRPGGPATPGDVILRGFAHPV